MKAERQALQFLQGKVNLMVLPVHKANATVTVNTEDYIKTRKTAILLADPVHRRLDPTEAVERKTSALVFTARRSCQTAATTWFEVTQDVWAPENT